MTFTAASNTAYPIIVFVAMRNVPTKATATLLG